jgi:hypothetical protein
MKSTLLLEFQEPARFYSLAVIEWFDWQSSFSFYEKEVTDLKSPEGRSNAKIRSSSHGAADKMTTDKATTNNIRQYD